MRTQGLGLGGQVAARTAHAAQLRGSAFDAGADPGLFTGKRVATAAEQLALAFEHQHQGRIGVGAQFSGKGDAGEVVTLALPTRHAGPGHAVLGLQRLHIGLVLGLVEAKQRLALFDQFALLHQNPADHAGAEGLYRLALARHHHGALYRDALVQRCEAGPEEKPAGTDNGHHPAHFYEKAGITFFDLRFNGKAAHAPGFLAAGY